MNIFHRRGLVTKGLYVVEHPAQLDYDEVRPIPYSITWEGFKKGAKIHTDCSGMVSMLYHWEGLEDPNGNHYDGAGFTGTLWGNNPHKFTDPAHAHPGCLRIYYTGSMAAPDTIHVAMVTEHDDRNPLMFSFGANPPRSIRMLDEDALHAGQDAIFLDMDHINALS